VKFGYKEISDGKPKPSLNMSTKESLNNCLTELQVNLCTHKRAENIIAALQKYS